jgi:hypothetical protein
MLSGLLFGKPLKGFLKNNMKNLKKIIYFLPIFIYTKIAQARTLDTNTVGKISLQADSFRQKAGFDLSGNIGSISKTIITAFLSLLSLIFLILILIAGYSWMTAAGDESKVTYAKETMKRAVIGLLITAAAYTITYFIFDNIKF